MLDPSDYDLVRRVTESGDHAAFTELVARHEAWLTRFMYKWTQQDPYEAEDLVQITFLVIWRKQAKLPPDIPFHAWLCGVAKRLAINRLRKIGRRPLPVSLNEIGENMVTEEEPGSNPPAESIRQEKIEEVRAALPKLAPLAREVVVLFYFKKLSYKEIALECGITRSAVGNLLNRARQELKEYLQ